jgi:anti-sigma28 factor (negative regulator of flagellin synthesis)
MKIEQQGYAGSTQGTGRTAGSGNVTNVAYSQFRNPGPGAVEDQGDHADVSQTAQVYQTAQAARSAQVEKLSGLVRSGGYSVDPVAISQSLVAETVAAQAAR